MGDPVVLHPQLGPLGGLLGTWEGKGAGSYPTIEPFRYHEQVHFGHVGKPFLAYQQKTWDEDNGAPLHAEVGYLRVVAATSPVRLEFILAHPTGIAEVEEGTLANGVLCLVTTTVGRTATAKRVYSLRREFRIEDDELRYDVWMAHGDTPETHHLHAVLDRTA